MTLEIGYKPHSEWGSDPNGDYGVATISRLLKIIGLFCKRAL